MAGKIFTYPNEIIAVRIAIAKFHLSDNVEVNESDESSNSENYEMEWIGNNIKILNFINWFKFGIIFKFKYIQIF